MELLIKIGDSGSWKDGQVISAKPDGWLVSPTDMLAWIDDGTEPALLASMPGYMADRLRRRVNRLRFELAATPKAMVDAFKIPEDGATLDKEIAVADRARMVAEGVDTNWGSQDLKSHFALRVDGMTGHEVAECLEGDNGTDYLATPGERRRNRVAYETTYDAKKLEDIQDKALRVDVDRVTAIDKTAIKANATAIEAKK